MNSLHKNIFALAAALLIAVSAGVIASAQEIKIGIIGPMKFDPGKAMWNGAVLAADQINARGGVMVGKKKMKIRLVQADSNELLNVTDATNAMERLINNDRVDFILGGFRTEAVLAMQDIAMAKKKIFFACGAGHDELCNRVARDYSTYKYFFRGTPYGNTYLMKSTFSYFKAAADAVKAQLKLDRVKVAIVMEKAATGDALTKSSEALIPKMGMEVVGIWRPSPNATDCTAELTAIDRSGAHIIFTYFSAGAGLTFAKQGGELRIPAIQCGINVEAGKDDFWKNSQGKAGYVITSTTYARGVEYNELTNGFVYPYMARFKETPTYCSDTYVVIKYRLVEAIEKTASLDVDKLIPFLEKLVIKEPHGLQKYILTADGRQNHEIAWGPGLQHGIAIQWVNGRMNGVWPYKWKAAPQAPEVTLKGTVPVQLPPWMIAKYKKK